MVLLKCKCGCFMTVADDRLFDSRYGLMCPNCNNRLDTTSGANFSDFPKIIKDAEFSVELIPDTATVKVEFNT